ncbi:High affinity transport system protein p37 precursor [Mesomycoplasma conjunctivae]|uniref:P37-like ABC transporter substrate-bi n=1 Tax=Mesomycoplasma conjunctivae (strain ATCC 25834 / NCTC 10147 / HRC/581) TaxID=572263 RepID=C5J5J8_MESCH|nr:DNA repair protein HhH-GPD [Mesomycoplasma conjunctivae]CAT04721.1 Putative P37-like ABC transporter substrate-bi [Mesomycoplasma conjunctivae]VEU65719.1 High affinity transport system protein p37 precursor [Mesomycoplasma conjunctivae]
MKFNFLRNKKKITKKFFVIFFSPLFLILSSCSRQAVVQQQWDTKVNLGLGQSWFKLKSEDPNRVKTFLNNFTNEFNRLQLADPETANQAKVSFDFIGIDDGQTIISQLLSSDNSENAIDFGITNSISTIELDRNNQLQNLLQTTTNAFKDDSELTFFQDNNNLLAEATNNLNKSFLQTPFNNWSNDENGLQKWNGIVYKFLYDLNDKQVNFYRGMIMIAGDDAKRSKIKKAWDDKDFITFRNFGIIHGNESSAGRWKLQENILKQHFGDKFTTLKEDKINNPDKYILKEGRDIGQDPNFAIAFDDEASFAWNQNKGDGKRYTSIEPNGKVEVFALTNPLLYDIGSFRSDFNKKQAELIVQTFINLAENKTDTYGPNVGYNGYRKIHSKNEILKIYNKSLNKNE